MADAADEVILGVDTHDETHIGVLLDAVGRRLGARAIRADDAGHEEFVAWAQAHGRLERAGVEGTGSYGAPLGRFLAARGVRVTEVNRPNRQRRRQRGTSDPADAEAAARAVLAGDATAVPKARDGVVESLRVLQVVRASAVKARTQVANQLKALAVTAPDPLREALRPLTTARRVAWCAQLHPGAGTAPLEATARALRHLARRWHALDAEVRELDADLAGLTQATAPRLLSQPGVGPGCAARLLVVAGDHPTRLRSDAALAALCGASPIAAASGNVVRHRLNRGGDRQANNALWTIATNRLRHHPETRAYAARRTREGRSKKEIVRCLMRHLARRLSPLLLADLAASAAALPRVAAYSVSSVRRRVPTFRASATFVSAAHRGRVSLRTGPGLWLARPQRFGPAASHRGRSPQRRERRRPVLM
jgi:transposase